MGAAGAVLVVLVSCAGVAAASKVLLHQSYLHPDSVGVARAERDERGEGGWLDWLDQGPRVGNNRGTLDQITSVFYADSLRDHSTTHLHALTSPSLIPAHYFLDESDIGL